MDDFADMETKLERVVTAWVDMVERIGANSEQPIPILTIRTDGDSLTEFWQANLPGVMHGKEAELFMRWVSTLAN